MGCDPAPARLGDRAAPATILSDMMTAGTVLAVTNREFGD